MIIKLHTLTLLLILFVVGCTPSFYEGGISNLKFQNNKYGYLVVYINDNVPETPDFIDKLQATLSGASKYLYQATRKRASFGKVFIRIPNSWQKKNGYADAPPQFIKAKADILISPPHPSVRNFPFTRSYAGCGHPGIHIQLNTDFILKPGTFGSVCANPPICGKPDRFLVHEFATYRYGVFNEHPFPGEDAYYFSPLTGKLERVRCSLGQFGRLYQRVNGQISGCTVDPDTGSYTDQCQYVAYPLHNQGSSSLMEYQWRQETVDFCDDTVTDMKANKYGHNREPHTQQNRLCTHRSTWDVISNSQDFVNNINPPTNSYVDSGVMVFHATSRKRIALIMDMADKDTKNISHTVKNFARGLDGTTDTTVHTLSLNPDSTISRHQRSISPWRLQTYLISDQENEYKKTGIRKFLRNFVKNRPNDTSLYTVLLLCGNNLSLTKSDIQMFTDNDLVSHVISCKDVGHEVENVIKGSGGMFHEVDPNRKLTSLNHAFDTLHYALNDRDTNPVQILNEVVEVMPNSKMTSSFIWDEYLLGDLMVSAHYDVDPPVVTLQSSENRQFSESDVEYSHKADTKTILLYVTKTKIMNGKWSLNLMNKNETTSKVHILVQSINVTDNSQYPITMKSWTKVFNENGKIPKIGIYTDVMQGHHPVSGVTVTAQVYREDGNEHIVYLLDNGAGADIERDDGIYSRYFPHIHPSPGPYHVIVRVTDHKTNGAIIKKEILTNINPELEALGGVPDFQYNITKIPLKFGLSRTAAAGTIRISDHIHQRHFRSTSTNTENSYMPVRVHNVKVTRVSQADKSFIVSWTAPGSLLDHGKASSYKFIYHNDTDLLLDYPERAKELKKNDILKGNKSDPAKAGSEESFRFRMPGDHSAIGFRLCAVSSHSTACEFSNMVTIGFPLDERARGKSEVIKN